MNIAPNITAKLDAKVGEGKLVPYWRKFLMLHSIRWSMTGFVISAANGVSLAWGLHDPLDIFLPRIAVWFVMSAVCLVSMYERMKPQPNVTGN